MSIILGEVREWISTDSLTSDEPAETNMPVDNLSNYDLNLRYRDTHAGVKGFTWDYAASVSAFAVEVAAVLTDSTTDKQCDLRLATGKPYNTINDVAVAELFALNTNSVYDVTHWTPDGLCFNVLFGIDALDTDPTTHTDPKTPQLVAHQSGWFRWRGATMPQGYHEAGYLAIGVNPLTFPSIALSDFQCAAIDLPDGPGYQYTVTWTSMPADETGTTGGLKELIGFVDAQKHRPVFAFFRNVGKTDAGVMAEEVTQQYRGGLMKITSFETAGIGWVSGSHGFRATLGLQTWPGERRD